MIFVKKNASITNCLHFTDEWWVTFRTCPRVGGNFFKNASSLALARDLMTCKVMFCVSVRCRAQPICGTDLNVKGQSEAWGKLKGQITRNDSTTTKTATQDRAVCLYLLQGWITSEYFSGRQPYKAQENGIRSGFCFSATRQRSEGAFIRTYRKSCWKGSNWSALLFYCCFSDEVVFTGTKRTKDGAQKMRGKLKCTLRSPVHNAESSENRHLSQREQEFLKIE